MRLPSTNDFISGVTALSRPGEKTARDLNDGDLGSRLESAADRNGRLHLVAPEGETVHLWSDVHEMALAGANSLKKFGVGRNSIVAIAGKSSIEVVTAVRACWMLGAAVMMIALPATRRRNSMVSQRLTDMRATVSPAMVIADQDVLKSVAEAFNCPSLSSGEWGRLCLGSRDIEDVHSPVDMRDKSLAVIQFTSGTTGRPKALAVGAGQLLHNVDASAEGLRLDPSSDVFVSWLPLSHDMGLIGMLAVSMLHSSDLVLMDTSMFVGNPATWMESCSSFGGTITAGPSFAYEVATRLLKKDMEMDLSALRLAVNGAEAISVDGFEGFLKSGVAYGLEPTAAFTVYGLAEATLAVTFPLPGVGLESDRVSEASLEQWTARSVGAEFARSRRLALLGRPIGGMEVAIDSGGVRSHGEGVIGEVVVKGDSVVERYSDGGSVKRGNWLYTGDLGYFRRGQLVVCGRNKDLIVIGGRNLFPSEVERAIGNLVGVHHGQCAAIGVEERGTERMAIVAETEFSADQRAGLEKAIRDAVLDGWDVAVRAIVFVSPGEIPKTTSGKISRNACKRLFD